MKVVVVLEKRDGVARHDGAYQQHVDLRLDVVVARVVVCL
jgi:hypothetical protein